MTIDACLTIDLVTLQHHEDLKLLSLSLSSKVENGKTIDQTQKRSNNAILCIYLLTKQDNISSSGALNAIAR